MEDAVAGGLADTGSSTAPRPYKKTTGLADARRVREETAASHRRNAKDNDLAMRRLRDVGMTEA